VTEDQRGAAPLLPPPGWYSDGTALRWWDGARWGPYAPLQHPAAGYGVGAPTTRTWAVLSHLGIFLGGFVLPLVVRLTDGERNEFSRHHATEALNLNITFMIVWVGLYIPGFIVAIVTHGIGLLLVIPVMLCLFVLGVVWAIQGAIRANRGEWWTYPLIFRFVKGARPRTGPDAR
jgi:uncharacterized Tic20 family protein